MRKESRSLLPSTVLSAPYGALRTSAKAQFWRVLDHDRYILGPKLKELARGPTVLVHRC